MSIDDASPLPIYEQICRSVRAAIAVGDLPPGTALPTTRELADFLKIGRNTVVTSYLRLSAEGYVLTNKRRGTRVADDWKTAQHSTRGTAPATELSQTAVPPAMDTRATTNVLHISFRAQQMLGTAEPKDMSPTDLQAPDSSLYPRNPLSNLLAEEFSRPPGSGDLTNGIRKFQAAIAQYLRQMRGVLCNPDQIIPTRSLESALDLTARVMIDPGHWVYIEDPTPAIVRDSFRSAGANLAFIPSDNNGADISLMSGPPPRMIFVSPSVSMPLGRQMPEERRQGILDAARNWNSIIFECDSRWELSFTGTRIRAIQGRDPSAPVLYFGSLNESLGPHIRAGYIVVPQQFIEPFSQMAQRVANGPDSFILGALANYLQSSDYAVHARKVRLIYAQRSKAIADAIRSRIKGVSCAEPCGGLQLAIHFDEPIDERAMCRAAAARGLSVAALTQYYGDLHNNLDQSGIVLGIGMIPEHSIDALIGRLDEALGDARSRGMSQSLVA